MFKINGKHEVNSSISKCHCNRYNPAETSTINTAISQIYINIPRIDSAISLLDRYLDLYFGVLHAATDNRDAEVNDIRLVNLGSIALVCTYRLTTSSGQHLEGFSHAHIVCLMCKILTIAKDSDCLSIRFDRGRFRRK